MKRIQGTCMCVLPPTTWFSVVVHMIDLCLSLVNYKDYGWESFGITIKKHKRTFKYHVACTQSTCTRMKYVDSNKDLRRF
jgi:hypothetical protein